MWEDSEQMSLTPDAHARLRRHIETSIETKRKLLAGDVGPVLNAARVMTERRVWQPRGMVSLTSSFLT